MCGFDGVRRGNYFGGQPSRRTEAEVKVRKLKNVKAAVKDEVTGDMIKGGGNKAEDWIWRLCNMAFESGVVPEDWRSAVITPPYKGKREMTKCSNYMAISFLSVVGKIYAGILVDRVRKVTDGLVDDEQVWFRVVRDCVNQTFTLKEIGGKGHDTSLSYTTIDSKTLNLTSR